MKLELIDKSVIAAEIERRIAAYRKNFDKADNKIARLSTDGRMQSLKELLSFLDTLEVKEVEEPSKDLEEAADTYVKVWYKIHDLDAESYPIDVKISKTYFIAGAKWYKEQLKRLKEE